VVARLHLPAEEDEVVVEGKEEEVEAIMEEIVPAKAGAEEPMKATPAAAPAATAEATMAGIHRPNPTGGVEAVAISRQEVDRRDEVVAEEAGGAAHRTIILLLPIIRVLLLTTGIIRNRIIRPKKK